MLNQRQQFTCPCCGGYLGEAAPIEFVAERIPKGQQSVIFSVLSKRVGRPVAKETIMGLLFGDRADGGPDTADKMINVQFVYLRRSLSGYGWVLKRTGGGHGTPVFYQLMPLEAGPC